MQNKVMMKEKVKNETISIVIIIKIKIIVIKKIKSEKQKNIPPGLQKKVDNGGTLPPGWQKKIEKGEVVNSTILSNGRIVTSKYPKIKNTEVYEVENRVFRIYKDTKEILDILK